MIDKVHIKNFKCLRDLDLEFKKLTILMGPNNSGKSTVLQALAFLAQQTGDITFDGAFVRLNSFRDVVFQKDTSNEIGIDVSLKLSDKELENVKSETASNAYKAFDFSSVRAAVSINLEGRNSLRPYLGFFTKDNELIGERAYTGRGKYELRFNQKITSGSHDGGNVDQIWPWGFGPVPSGAKFCGDVADTVKSIMRDRILNQLYYLAPFRKVDERVEKIIEAEPTRISPEGKNTLTLFLYTKVNQDLQFAKMVRWAKEFNVSDILSKLEKGQAKAAFKDEELPVEVDAPELGFGSNQLFPVIVQFFACKPNSILMVEEPEMSLHVAAQVKLPYLFSEVLEESKQIIVSTHSVFIPLAIGKAIRDRSCSLTKEDVQIFEFKKEKNGTQKTVLSLDQRGNIENWISEVAKVEDELYKDWAAILPKEL